MDYVTLGRTGLRVSVMGLGGGGPSRLGQSTGQDEADSIRVVRRALELGVNFFDSAEAYKTEPILAKALAEVDREQVVISTKKHAHRQDTLLSGAEMVEGVEASLRRLNTDYLDIFHIHGLAAEHYDHVYSEIVPALVRLKEQGKIRFLGVTESWSRDPQHLMMQRAVQDDCWDVMMVGFNMLNQSARERIFPATIAKGIGVLIMFAVRKALSQPQVLNETMQQLVSDGLVESSAFDAQDPLGFLGHAGGATSVPDAAYRYCRYEPGVHVVLSGTGNVAHLEQNVASLLRPPLPSADIARVNALFAGVDTVWGG